MVRSTADDDQLAERVAGIWRARSDRYSERRSARTQRMRRVEMSHIGG